MNRVFAFLLAVSLVFCASAAALVSAEGSGQSLNDILGRPAPESPDLSYAPSTETVYARKFTVAPSIDGIVSADEWGEATLKNVRDNGNGLFPSTFACRVDTADDGALRSDEIKPGAPAFSAWLRWDEDRLYIALITEDDSHFNSYVITQPKMMWQGDSLQISVSTAGNWAMIYGNQPQTFEGSTHYNKAVFAGDNRGTDSYRALCGAYANANPNDTVVAIKNDGTQTTYEIAIEWTAFFDEEPSVKAGDILGMALGLVSGSAKSIEHYLTWGDMVFGSPNDSTNRLVPLHGSQRVGDNKVILSEYDIYSTEQEPAIPKYSVKFYSEITGKKVELDSYICEPQDYLRDPYVSSVDGYSFLRWEGNYDIDLGGPITEDIELTAVYVRLYKVTFRNEKDGKVLLTKKVLLGESVDPPTPRPQENFLRWSTDEYKNVQKDLDIYAVYRTDGQSDGNDDGSNTVLIVCVAVGAIAVVSAILFILVRRKKKNDAAS